MYHGGFTAFSHRWLVFMLSQTAPGTAIRATAKPFSAFKAALTANEKRLFFFRLLHVQFRRDNGPFTIEGITVILAGICKNLCL